MIGLIVAGAAPFIVRYLGDALEARAKRRTTRLIEASRDRNA
ncbi:MAG TPA: hypothetical protein VGH28_11090 [Polyangiaceae bacterium]